MKSLFVFATLLVAASATASPSVLRCVLPDPSQGPTFLEATIVDHSTLQMIRYERFGIPAGSKAQLLNKSNDSDRLVFELTHGMAWEELTLRTSDLESLPKDKLMRNVKLSFCDIDGGCSAVKMNCVRN